LLLIARREDPLRSLCAELSENGADAEFITGDITSSAVRQTVERTMMDRWGALDILVNNAGVGAVGPFGNANPQRLIQIFDLNFFAPVALIRATLPLLLRGDDPAIVNIGSVLGHVAAPFKSEYCASKFALLGFSNAIRMELRQQGVEVLVVTPSTTASDFFSHLVEDTTTLSRTAPAHRRWAMPPDYVARRILRALETRQRELFLPPISAWILPLLQVCPTMADWLAARFSSIEDRGP
jgi:short-subunit dehydrogenase